MERAVVEENLKSFNQNADQLLKKAYKKNQHKAPILERLNVFCNSKIWGQQRWDVYVSFLADREDVYGDDDVEREDECRGGQVGTYSQEF